MPKPPDQDLLGLIRGISLFKGFTPSEAKELLRVTRLKKIRPRQIVYERGGASTEMLILSRGELIVQSEKGIHIARIRPGECVGEMGVLTDAPRSARVVAAEASVGLVIRKNDLDAFLRNKRETRVKFQASVIDLLAGRLRRTGRLVDEVASDKWRQKQRAPRALSGPMGPVTIRLPLDIVESLKSHAAVTGESLSDIVRRALSIYMKP